MFGRRGEPDNETEYTFNSKQLSQDIPHDIISNLANRDGKVVQDIHQFTGRQAMNIQLDKGLEVENIIN